MERNDNPPLRSVFFRLYDFVYTNRPLVSDDDTCMICHEVYHPLADDGCHPVTLKPCGHIIGHECFLKWAYHRGKMQCILCNKGEVEIEGVSFTVPPALKLLYEISHMSFYTYFDDRLRNATICQKGQLVAGELPAFDIKVFAGNLFVDHMAVTFVDLPTLWLCMLLAWLLLSQAFGIICWSFAGAGYASLPMCLVLFCTWSKWPFVILFKIMLVESVMAFAVSLALVAVGVHYPWGTTAARN